MKSYLEKIDTNTTGNRNDVTPLFADREAFAQLVADLAEPFKNEPIDVVVAIDALGFILGTALAESLGVGLVPARKRGKLPVEALRVEFVDYSGDQKSLEMRPDALSPGLRVLIVDEWVETGAQIGAAISLVSQLGGIVAGIATICMDDNKNTRTIRDSFFVHTVWENEELPNAAGN